MNSERVSKIFSVFLSIIILFSIEGNQHLSAQTKVIEPKSRALLGSSKTNCTDGKYLYLGAGGTVIISRIISTDSVFQLSECYFPSTVEDITVKDKTLFVSDLLTGLHILDVKDVYHPREIAKLYFPNRSYGLILDSTNLFISHGSDGVSKVDITNLSNPATLIEARFPCNRLRTYSNFLYCINNDGITIAEIARLDSVGSFSSSDIVNIVGLEFSNNKGILVENYLGLDNWSNSTLTLIDLSTPITPKRRGFLRLPLQTSFKNRSDTVLCLTRDTIYTIDANYISSPTIISRTQGITGDFVSIKDTLLFISRDHFSEFQLVNIKNILHPRKGFHLSTLADIGSIEATDSLLIAGRFANPGLLLVDIRDIFNPRIKFEYKNDIGSVRGIRLMNGHIYAASQQGLKVFDVIGADSLKLIGELNYGSWAMKLDVADTLAACGGSYDDVHLISVAHPSNPKYITNIPMPTSMYVDGIFLRDTLLFVNGGYGGVRIYSVSSPSKPILVWEKYYNSCEAIYPVGNTLFVADFSTLHAFDISVPNNPIELGSFDFGRRIVDISVKGSLAFVSLFSNGYYEDNGMIILDVHSLDSIKEVARANTPGWSNAICTNAHYVFLSDHLNGVYIYDQKEIITNISLLSSCGFPASYRLFQNYPNPFNPITTINYSVPQSSFVTIKVYDVLGREVETLVNEYKQAGYYNCKLRIENGELPSGVYFYKLQTDNGFSETKKMLLLK